MTKFSDLKLDPKVLKAIVEAGYDQPTPIQAGAIPPALEGRDVLGIAQTGTGKTASFTLPMITLLGRGRARARMPRSLVLCPTRELAAQVAENFDIYAKHTRLTKALLIGGVSFGEQDKLIDRGVDVLIATPGRLLDHFERGKLLLTGVQIMVVDEADRMLDMGFIPDIERIFQLTPFTRQTLFFSATMAPEIERITNTFLHAPERIEVARQATTSETITQKLIELTPTRKDRTAKQKRELLRAVIDDEGEALTNAIIFCNRKIDVDIVAKSLKSHGYDASPIHGDLDQSHRTRTLDGFRDGQLKLLVASDVAARGLDIPAVSHVLNFDLPSHAEDYVHRIGRTGRAGRTGTAISISTPADEKLLAAIENLVKQTLPRVALPEGFTLSEEAVSAPQPRDDRRGGRNTRRRSGRGDAGRDPAQSDSARADAGRSDSGRGDAVRGDAVRGDGERAAGQTDRTDTSRNDAVQADNRRRDDSALRDAGREGGREGGRDQRSAGRDGGRRGRGRDDSRGGAIVGMGDHVPEFMLAELRPALLSASAETDETPKGQSRPEPASEEKLSEKPADKPAEKPARPARRSRRPRTSPAPTTETAPEATTGTEPETAPEAEAPSETAPAVMQAAPVEAPVEETAPAAEAEVKPGSVPATEEAAVEATPEPAPKPAARPRRSRATAKPAAEAKPETEAETETPQATEAAETPAKPRATRTRRKPAAPKDDAPQAAGEAEQAAETAPAAPRRTRRTAKPAEAAEQAAPDSAGAAAEEKPAPKPRRTRRTKAAEEPTPAAAEEPAQKPANQAD